MGLITYGTHVHVHELGFTECAKSYVFRGSKEYTPASVAEQLGLAGRAVRGPPGAPQQVGWRYNFACLPAKRVATLQQAKPSTAYPLQPV